MLQNLKISSMKKHLKIWKGMNVKNAVEDVKLSLWFIL